MKRIAIRAAFVLSLAFGLHGSALFAQILGGAETAKFQAGDLALYQEDLSGTSIGEEAEAWEVVRGSYEVAEFQGKRWFRPLERDARILYPLTFPREFSIEFTTYLSAQAAPYLKMFLYTSQDLERERMGPDGPSQLYLIIGRGYNPDHDFVHLRVYDPQRQGYRDVVTPGSYQFAPNRLHRVALQVREGKLHLFMDGTRIGTASFRAEAVLKAIGFMFDAGYGHEMPYKDRPALLTELRIATYTAPVPQPWGGVRLFIALPLSEEKLPMPFSHRKTLTSSFFLKDLKQRNGWDEATLVVLRGLQPSASGKIKIQMPQKEKEELMAQLKETLQAAARLGGGLVMVGDGSDASTERERKLLSSLRALTFAAWLAHQGFGEAKALSHFVAEGGEYQGIYLHYTIGTETSGYVGIFQ